MEIFGEFFECGVGEGSDYFEEIGGIGAGEVDVLKSLGYVWGLF